VTRLYVSRALLAEGWRSDVLIAIEGCMISAITPDVPSPADALHVAGVAVPGLPNVHSHAFQRAMAGLTERRGPEDDSFWTWREVMYRFLARMTPDDIQDVAALAYLEMLEAGFTTVGEFHYVHKAPDGSQYADPAETAGRIVSAAAQCGIGLTLLPCFYAHGGCGGKAARSPVKCAFSRISMASQQSLKVADGTFSHSKAPGWALLPIPCALSMLANWNTSCAHSLRGPSTSTPRSRYSRLRSVWPGPGHGPSSGCSTIFRWTGAGA